MPRTVLYLVMVPSQSHKWHHSNFFLEQFQIQGDHLQVLLVIMFWGDQYLIFSSSPYDFWSQHIGRFWYLYVLSGSASHVVARHLIYQNGSSVICSILWLKWDTWMTKMSIFLIMCVFKVYKNYHHYNFSIQHDIHYIFHQHIKKIILIIQAYHFNHKMLHMTEVPFW